MVPRTFLEMSEIVIRPYDGEADLSAFVSLYKHVWSKTPAYAEVFEDEEIVSTIAKQEVFLIAVRGDELVGFIGGYPLVKYDNKKIAPNVSSPAQTFYMDELGRALSVRGLGVGDALLQRFIHACRQLGYRELVLKTTNEKSNPAQDFYRRNSFTELLTKDRGERITVEIEQTRTDGLIHKDERLYFRRDI